MANDSSIFTPDTSGTQADDDARQQKIKQAGQAFGLKGLFSAASAATPNAQEDLQAANSMGGAITNAPTVSPATEAKASGAGEPSALATENVPRAPIVQGAAPLLSPEE